MTNAKPDSAAALVTKLGEKATPRPWAVHDANACGPDGRWGVWHPATGGQIFYVGDPYPRGDNAPFENSQLAALAVNSIGLVLEALDDVLEHLDFYGHKACSDTIKARQALATVREAAQKALKEEA